MAGILGAASIPFIGCVSLLIAMILHILSFASPFWASDDYADFGLWRSTRCVTEEITDIRNGGCYRWNHHWDVSDWMWAVRAMTMLTILMWSIPLVVLPVYIYVALGLWYTRTLGVMTFFVWLGAAADLVAVIIYGIKIDDNDWDVGWAYIVGIIGLGFGVVAAIIFLIATAFRPKFKPQRHFVSGFYVDPDKNQLYVVETIEPPPKPGSTIVDPGQVNPALVVDD